MKKVTDVISEMGGSIFSDAEENFSIPKVKQPIIEEGSFMYSLHQSSGIFQSSVSLSFDTSTFVEQREKGRS